MKSQQNKKRLAREEVIREAAILARESDTFLMALYEAFLPKARGGRTPKFTDDKYGNRVLSEGIKV